MISKEILRKIRQIEIRSRWLGWAMLLVIVCLVSGVVSGCSTKRKNSGVRVAAANDQEAAVSALAGYPVAGFVVLPGDRVRLPSSFGSRYAPLWTPTTNEAAKAITLLPEFLIETANDESLYVSYSKESKSVLERLPKTVCQAVGVTVEGKRGILMNFLPKEGLLSHRWESSFVRVSDGGSEWWSVVYLPAERRFTGLWIDLGF